MTGSHARAWFGILIPKGETMNEDEKKKVMNVTGAAAYLRALGFAVSNWTVRDLIHKKRLTAIPVGKKHYIAIAELDSLVMPKKK
jgi:hypothetical protein